MPILNCTPDQAQACRKEYGEAHDNQLEVMGECAWCGAYVSEDTPLGHVDMETGNVYAADGSMLEQHDFTVD